MLVERQAEPGDQERDGENDADVEQVDEAVEWVSDGVFEAAVATKSRTSIHRSILGGIVARSSAVRSSLYVRVRVSVNANATVPTSSPIVVAANAVRRSVASMLTSPRPSAASPGAKWNQGAHQTKRRSSANEDAGVVQTSLDGELVVGERVLDAGLLAGEDGSGDLEQRVARDRAWCAG